MPIHHMLYRCPRCGHDPLEGRKGRAKCSSCGTRFEQGRGSLILMSPPQGPVEEASATSLLADLEKMGGAGTGREGGTDSSGESLLREARVAFGTAGGYAVIRWWGEVIGFSERISWKGEGLIRLEGESLTFTPDGAYVLTANEGEPSDDYKNDPEGSVSIIKVADKSVRTAGFGAFSRDKLPSERAGVAQ